MNCGWIKLVIIMNYFPCSVGEKKKLTILCDAEFANKTITCSNSNIILQGICSNTEPYIVEFNIPKSGAWLISAQLNGIDYTQTVTISDYNVNL